ncbi:Adenosylmethionine-8-amino-7-oxononanoate aminotransferase [Hyphomicrobium sp. 1Nfss2.1]|uniref:adenosylmethionine--8-amino-7-oxononanoate transaminase n=1 Tax=Hyphomicrobium sp. 1Nfss2.1 TaxID=3413936 RepID=UPI003C7A2EBA
MTSRATTTSSPIWHPFTQHGLQPEMIPVRSARGAWIKTPAGELILDAISSWWVVTHGHCHPRIVGAIEEQARRLDQVIFAGFTHAPAEMLARGLIDIAPEGLAHVFFSDSGSTSVEVALKMALGYFRNIGAPRRRIVALEHGYHGDTIGGMSVGARGIFSATYEPLLFEVERIPFPSPGNEQATIDAFDAACANEPTAALIVEPLVLGAGGMLVYDARVLQELQRIARHHGALFIADEVMTGWGRTGALFACDKAGVTPDILCLAKGITGGSLPLAVTLCTSEIFEAHRSSDRSKTFFHSSSYTANPIACAAAVANLEIWREEPVLDKITALTMAQEERLAAQRSHSAFSDARQIGTITALDLKVSDAGYLASVGLRLMQHFLDRGVLLRPLGNTIYVMPPYCITPDELDLVYAAIAEAPAAVAGESP